MCRGARKKVRRWRGCGWRAFWLRPFQKPAKKRAESHYSLSPACIFYCALRRPVGCPVVYLPGWVSCFYTSGRLNYHEWKYAHPQERDKAQYFIKIASRDVLLRKRKEKKPKVRHYVNSNENDYQFDVVLILLRSEFVICVLEIQSG